MKSKKNHPEPPGSTTVVESVEKLEHAGLDVSRIEFVALTGDSGGGGAVQNIFGPFVEIK